MLYNDNDGKQGALFARSNKSLLETEMLNSDKFSFWFLPGIKKGMCYSMAASTEIIHVCVSVSRKLLTSLWGEHWKNNSKPDVSVRQQLLQCLLIKSTNPQTREDPEKYFRLIVHIAYTLLKSFTANLNLNIIFIHRWKKNICVVGCPCEIIQIPAINHVEQ